MDKETKPRVSIIIPAYNEEGNVEELCRQLEEMKSSSDFSFEVVLIDDGSTDGTPGILRSLCSRYEFLQVFTHGYNRGLTEALQTGFSNARGEIFVFYPAD
ncbi:MAG: glycosyltransferase family 2 protein, partial [FCB group bacterium]|nr:glycosyltransferase family 2 protein [FCB group bacterium]